MKAHLNSPTAAWGSACRQTGHCMTSQSMKLRRCCSSLLLLLNIFMSAVISRLWTDGGLLYSHSVTHLSWICVRIWATCRVWMNAEFCTRWPVELKPTCRSHTRDPTWSTSGLRYRRTARCLSASLLMTHPPSQFPNLKSLILTFLFLYFNLNCFDCSQNILWF